MTSTGSAGATRARKLTNPNDFVKISSLFRDLWLIGGSDIHHELAFPERDFLDRTNYRAQGLAILNYYKVRYIVQYRDATNGRQMNEYRAVLYQVLGQDAKPYYQDAQMIVYAVPSSPTPANPLTLDVGTGWYPAETDTSGRVFRWADLTQRAPAELYSMNLSGSTLTRTLSFSDLSYSTPRTVVVSVNHTVAATIQVLPDVPREFNVELTLPPGNNLIAIDSPQAPLALPDRNVDARKLSFGMNSRSLQPK